MERKSRDWDNKHKQTVDEITGAISSLEILNIDDELQFHKDLAVWSELTKTKNQLEKDIATKTRHLTQLNSQLSSTISAYEQANNNTCPTCKQGIHDEKHHAIKNDLEAKIIKLDEQVNFEQNEITVHQTDLDNIKAALSTITKPTTIYETLEQALNHRNTLDQQG